jgi:type IV pilus assembly protein PilB
LTARLNGSHTTLPPARPTRPNGGRERSTDPGETTAPPRLLGDILLAEHLITWSQLEQALESQKGTRPYKPIGQILVEQGALTQDKLKSILDAFGKRSRLGEILVKSRAITREQLATAFEEQQRAGTRLGEALIGLNYVTEDTVRRALCTHLDIPFVDLNSYALDPRLTKIINRTYANKHVVVPVSLVDNVLTLAMDDPTDTAVVDDIRALRGLTINVVSSTRQALRRALWRLYAEGEADPDGTPRAEVVIADSTLPSEDGPEPGQADTIVRDLMAAALEHRASDIHLETIDYRVQARFRIDGVLRALTLPALNDSLARNGRAVVSRVKILGNLDIAERRRPQDGSFRVRVQRNGQYVNADCRVSVVPGYYGENVVVRILDQRNAPTTISQLAFSAPLSDKLEGLLRRPTGMILITGPTGSGKSTSLFAALMTLYRPGIKILTVEDPIEYVYEQFTQCEVNERIGNSFSSYLRAFLRHDPEVIMVGEVRDEESAELAFRAAQTGHLVLTTLHTNDAVSAVNRLLDLGVDRNVITSTLLGIVAQRLVRKNCERCRAEHAPSASVLRELFDGPGPDIRWYRGAGCPACDFTGYAGRIVVGELWVPSDHDVLLINKGAPFDEVVASARASTIAMAEDVRERLQAGVTSLEELVRALPYSSLYRFREPGFLG